ncbi:MAG: glycosyltransferase [Erysipelotrichia bacterium]|nr:glycosyltransferase [Erysipelotrichia bacterium]
MLNKIYIIIPILNPPEMFFRKLAPALLSQTVDPTIVLINSGDTIPGSYTSVNIDKKEFNHANTRNIALKHEADFYLFMTQDAMPYDEHLIAELLKAFEDEAVVVSYARQIPYKNADAIEVFARTTNYPAQSRIKSKEDLKQLGIKTFFCSDSCAMYRASYFKEVGGFKQGLNTNEDMEYAARAIMNGKKVAYVAETKVYHSHTFTCKDIWKRYRAIGKFFKENQWILDVVSQYTKAESTGIKQAVAELKYLLKNSPLDIPRSILFSLIKYIAYKIP